MDQVKTIFKMKKLALAGLGVLLAASLLLASCTGTSSTSTTSTTTTAATTTTSVATTPVVLTVINGSKTMTFSIAQLKQLTAVTGKGGTKNKTGAVSGPFVYHGVALTTILNKLGGISAGMSVKLTASDAYSKTLSYDQIMNGAFSTYDATGAVVTPSTAPIVALVYDNAGADLDSTTGPVELGLLYTQNYVSDGSVWVKMVQTIEILTANSTSTTTTNATVTTTSGTATTSAATTATMVPATTTILTVTNGKLVKNYNLNDLQAMQTVTGFGGTKGKTGTVKGPYTYVGVSLNDLLNVVGGISTGQSLKITGTDGYVTTYTYAQVTQVNFNTYDASGNSVTATKPFLAVVFSVNGALMDSSTGPLQLGVLSSDKIVMDGSSWIKVLKSIEIVNP